MKHIRALGIFSKCCYEYDKLILMQPNYISKFNKYFHK